MIIINKVPIPRLTEKDGIEKPFNPESFDINKEQQKLTQTNAKDISSSYCVVGGVEYYKI